MARPPTPIPPMQPPLPVHVVVMGVAGCGKSAVGAQVAARLALPLVEGDDFHPPGNIRKMQQGVPLTDADRAGWLDRLAAELAARPGGAVLTCSALKRVYRDALRSGATPVRFVHLAISPAQALQRVAARPGHFYPPSLVDSQFATLEDPSGEPGVRVFDGSRPVLQLTDDVVAALQKEFNIP